MLSMDGRADKCSCMIGTSAFHGGRILRTYTDFCSCIPQGHLEASIRYIHVGMDAGSAKYFLL